MSEEHRSPPQLQTDPAKLCRASNRQQRWSTTTASQRFSRSVDLCFGGEKNDFEMGFYQQRSKNTANCGFYLGYGSNRRSMGFRSLTSKVKTFLIVESGHRDEDMSGAAVERVEIHLNGNYQTGPSSPHMIFVIPS